METDPLPPSVVKTPHPESGFGESIQNIEPSVCFLCSPFFKTDSTGQIFLHFSEKQKIF